MSWLFPVSGRCCDCSGSSPESPHLSREHKINDWPLEAAADDEVTRQQRNLSSPAPTGSPSHPCPGGNLGRVALSQEFPKTSSARNHNIWRKETQKHSLEPCSESTHSLIWTGCSLNISVGFIGLLMESFWHGYAQQLSFFGLKWENNWTLIHKY